MLASHMFGDHNWGLTRVNVNTTDATTGGTGTALCTLFPSQICKVVALVPAILRSSALGNSFSRKRYYM